MLCLFLVLCFCFQCCVLFYVGFILRCVYFLCCVFFMLGLFVVLCLFYVGFIYCVVFFSCWVHFLCCVCHVSAIVNRSGSVRKGKPHGSWTPHLDTPSPCIKTGVNRLVIRMLLNNQRKNKLRRPIYYIFEAICRTISPGQYHVRYCPAIAAINISEFKQ